MVGKFCIHCTLWIDDVVSIVLAKLVSKLDLLKKYFFNNKTESIKYYLYVANFFQESLKNLFLNLAPLTAIIINTAIEKIFK